MVRVIHELRDLRITKIALVRKGFRPVNDGARITIVKAEEDPVSEPNTTEASVLDRLAGAIARIMKSEPAPAQATAEAAAAVVVAEPVVKADAEVASLEISPMGDHADFTGDHSHAHVSHYAVVTHEHEHDHRGDNSHYHSHIEKAEGEEHDHTLPEGWTLVSADDMRTMLGAAPVEKAEAAAADTDQVTTLTARVAELTEQLAAQVAKAEPDHSEAIATAVQSRVDAVLEPVVKALEDMGIDRARLAQTPNVTDSIDPSRAAAGSDPKTRTAAVQNMTYGDAVRHLMNH